MMMAPIPNLPRVGLPNRSTMGLGTGPPRHHTLGATLDWSYSLISESERVVLRRLAVFAGPFSLQGAVAVVGEENKSTVQVIEILEQLVAKSLISARPKGSSTRYRLLDTTRGYAMERLTDSGEANGIARRHARYVQDVLERTMVESSDNDQASASQQRGELLGDARAALNWAYSESAGAELRVSLTGACSRLFVELNLLSEARLWASRALELLDDTNRGSRWELELQSALGHPICFASVHKSRYTSWSSTNCFAAAMGFVIVRIDSWVKANKVAVNSDLSHVISKRQSAHAPRAWFA